MAVEDASSKKKAEGGESDDGEIEGSDEENHGKGSGPLSPLPLIYLCSQHNSTRPMRQERWCNMLRDQSSIAIDCGCSALCSAPPYHSLLLIRFGGSRAVCVVC